MTDTTDLIPRVRNNKHVCHHSFPAAGAPWPANSTVGQAFAVGIQSCTSLLPRFASIDSVHSCYGLAIESNPSDNLSASEQGTVCTYELIVTVLEMLLVIASCC